MSTNARNVELVAEVSLKCERFLHFHPLSTPHSPKYTCLLVRTKSTILKFRNYRLVQKSWAHSFDSSVLTLHMYDFEVT